MPLYTIFTDSVEDKIRIVSANCSGEAVGKARVRYRIPDDQACYAILQSESEITQDTVTLAAAVHAAMLKVFVYRDYARRRRYTGVVVQLTGIYDLMSKAYFDLTASVAQVEPTRPVRKRTQAS